MGLRRILFLAALIGVCLAGSASASPITFTVSGVFDDTSTLTGTLDIDVVTGIVTGGDLTISTVGEFNHLSSGGFGVFNFDSQGDNLWYSVDLTASAEQTDPYIQLALLLGPNTSLIGYEGGALCGDANVDCAGFMSNYSGTPVLLQSGSVAVPTPEPASFLLLAAPAVWTIFRRRHSTA
jgi:hypothetical protein